MTFLLTKALRAALAIGFLCASVLFAFSISPASAVPGLRSKKTSKIQFPWEELVKRGNNYMMRDRMPEARKYYRDALKILEDKKCDDLRKAVVLHDLAETYRFENNWHEARMNDVDSSAIYQRELSNNLLGGEYAHTKDFKVEPGSLRPACLVCHENWKVVPIQYGAKTGYDGPVPPDSDPAFTHKPGGIHIGDQRWYCRACHQPF